MPRYGGRLGDVKQNILNSADNYPPNVYYNLLSWYHDLEVQADPLGAEYIPVSATRENPSPFIVGVLPPAVRVTGRLLDRSASVAGLDPSGATAGGLAGPVGSFGGGGTAGEIISGIAKSHSGKNQRTSTDAYLDLIMSPGDKALPPGQLEWKTDYFLAQDTYSCALFGAAVLREAGLVESELQEAYKPGHAYANLKSVAVKYAAWVEGTDPGLPDIGDMVFQAEFSNPGATRHVTVLTSAPVVGEATDTMNGGQEPFGPWVYSQSRGRDPLPLPGYEETPYDPEDDADYPPKEVNGNEVWWTGSTTPGEGGYWTSDSVDEDSGGIGIGPAGMTWERRGSRWYTRSTQYNIQKSIQGWVDVSKLPIPGATDNGPPDWQGEGSGAAADASKDQNKLSGTTVSEAGLQFLEAQARQIKEAQLALEKMAKTPPLRLLVNPRSFDVKGAKIVNDGNWTRKGHVIEHWGDEQDKISASGRVAGFYAVDSLDTTKGPGLTRTARNYSAAWQNFQSLYMIYRNNGGVFLSDYDGEEGANLAYVGTVYIYYGGLLYLGSFDTFNISEEEGSPHTIEYSWEFTVRAAFMLDRIPGEDRYDHTYGAPGLIKGIKTDVLGKGYRIETNAALADPPLEGIEYIQALERGEIPIDDQDEDRVPVASPILDSLVEQAGANPGNTGGAEDEEPFAQPRFLPENI